MIEGKPAGSAVSLESDLEVGSILADKYRVERVLGKGGMGVVVAATHLELDVLVAIKILLPEFRSSQEVVARFSREARAAAQIKSEFVTRTIDVGRLGDGTPYIVMEYLNGADLAQRIQECGPLPVADAVRLVIEACEALSEAHRLGIVHRDFKPSNLFLVTRPDGTDAAKILDFGISKITHVGSVPQISMTRTSSMMGSPLYMSPEQLIDARNVDPRSDIWAIGATLFEALMGVPPFMGGSFPELCSCILTQPAPRLSFRPDVPPELEAIVLRCLEKDPAARFESALQLAQALRPFLNPLLSPSPNIQPVSLAPQAIPRPSRPWLAVGLVMALLAGLGVALVLAVRSPKNPAVARPTPSAVPATLPPTAASAVILPPSVAAPSSAAAAVPSSTPSSSQVAVAAPSQSLKTSKLPGAGDARPAGAAAKKPVASPANAADLLSERN